ncbi:MAG: divalent-cation tolerance protein CutA [Candidatus Methanomethylicota archaeon]|jgi:periplasmic divalent cation tolerance protein|uniref:Divalent-cation tolerance protein CutA n=1 Tax=Thermoproteota archaeon TaxID=2056631 RepID=A0A523BAV4_9CREN|nr:divalent-cation tolerance protein CutA [Candidatus Methanomethylicia archaeon]NHV45873.1 divalent-cation tolerance protein CutA [Candidatus Verstraetearchaeota archaeon]RZN57340.1 MAG: divalent-cation tolerance protein CutA [Candidatus Verstraetearchaeota archaeon]TDA38079.1 MAG: divalent-cation tolerance protein CutA [Candidatus Verstraetearchaeota archaeon]
MYSMVFITVGNEDEAKRIAKKLLEERLAACVNIIKDVKSYFLWKGEIDKAEEYLLIIKTIANKVNDIIKRVKEIHSYQVPEIIWINLSGGSEDYLNWINEELR